MTETEPMVSEKEYKEQSKFESEEEEGIPGDEMQFSEEIYHCSGIEIDRVGGNQFDIGYKERVGLLNRRSDVTILKDNRGEIVNFECPMLRYPSDNLKSVELPINTTAVKLCGLSQFGFVPCKFHLKENGSYWYKNGEQISEIE